MKAKHISATLLTGLSAYYKDSNSGVQTKWNTATDGSSVITIPSSQGSEPGYSLQMGGQGTLTAGKPLDATGAEKIRLNVILPPTFTNANTMVFVVFKEQNAVVKLNTDVSSKSFYTEGIPSGKAIKLISVSKVNGQYYFGSKDSTAAKGVIYKIVPEKKTEAKDIIATILNL